MPGMSGNDLAACLCKRRPETRILYISGYSGPTLLQHGVDGRETMFLEKPFTLKQMSAKIRQALSTGTLTETAMPFPEPTSPLV
jgi:FixJ family two-component response regulator